MKTHSVPRRRRKGGEQSVAEEGELNLDHLKSHYAKLPAVFSIDNHDHDEDMYGSDGADEEDEKEFVERLGRELTREALGEEEDVLFERSDNSEEEERKSETE